MLLLTRTAGSGSRQQDVELFLREPQAGAFLLLCQVEQPIKSASSRGWRGVSPRARYIALAWYSHISTKHNIYLSGILRMTP
jgi:hypothetical protein